MLLTTPRPARGQRGRSDVSAASLRRPSPARQVAVGSHPPPSARGVATIIGSSHRGQPRRQGRGTERAKPLSSAASLQYQMWNLLGNSGRKREDLGIVPAIQMDTCNLQRKWGSEFLGPWSGYSSSACAALPNMIRYKLIRYPYV